MKIVILGSTGMLGNAVGKYFVSEYGEDSVYLSYRNKDVAYGNSFEFDAVKSVKNGEFDIPECDYLINAVGVIKPFMSQSPSEAIMINSVFPHALSKWCNASGVKMIHITTDCVFSGAKGNYSENDLHDALDNYGKSKSIGEPTDCMVIRTSIIGEEIHKKASLVEWIKAQAGKTAKGFTNHLWNGVTTSQYANVCDQIIKKGLYAPSLYHVFSNIVTKEELLRMVNEKFNLGISIEPVAANESVDRTLTTVKDLNGKLDIPSLQSQISNL